MRLDAEYPVPYSRKPATMCIRLIRSGYLNVDTRKLRVTLIWQKVTSYEQHTLIKLLHCGAINLELTKCNSTVYLSQILNVI